MNEINVGGKLFLIPIEILNEIPYFKNVDTNTFIPRSSIIFEHVLSFILDGKYQYPKRFVYELDFYGIKYDSSQLYDPEIKINNGFKVVNENIITTNKNVINHNKKLSSIENNTDCSCIIQ